MTVMVSKSKAKAMILEYFREVEQSGREIVITDRGRPVVKLVKYYADPKDALRALNGSVIHYDDPTEPVGVEEWESLG